MVEFFYQVFCFTPIWGFVDLALLIHFCLSWYRSSKRTGWKVDLWYSCLLFSVVPSLLVLYPFNASIYNIPCTLGFYHQILPFIDRAFLISVIGYCSLWVGRYLFDIMRENFVFSVLFHLAKPLMKTVENNIKSDRVYVFLAVIAFILGALVLSIQFREGYFFNGREYFLQQPLFRPLFNLAVSLIPLSLSIFCLRYVQFNDRRCLKLFFLFLIFTLFFGVRAPLLLACLFFTLQWIFYREGRFSLFKLLSICLFLFVFAVILEDIRKGSFNFINSFFVTMFRFLYGNNFSDTRDFAWILSQWDGEYLYGKTYVAALISFIPRFLSPLREEWGFSMYTNALIGFDSEVMPGLRPGLFGEPFFNFGYLGVILFGTLYGFSIRYADFKTKEAVQESKDVIKGYCYTVVMNLVVLLGISAAMWAFYTFVALHVFLTLIRKIGMKRLINTSFPQ